MVRPRDDVDHDPAVHCRRDCREEEEWREDPAEADAACLHRHRLVITGEPSEGYQDTQQESHRDGYPERLRNQERQHPADLAWGYADPDQLLRPVTNRWQQEQEREHQQRQQKRRDNFPNDVPAGDAKHGETSISTDPIGRSRGGPSVAPRSDTSADPKPDQMLAEPTSDNVCYVNLWVAAPPTSGTLAASEDSFSHSSCCRNCSRICCTASINSRRGTLDFRNARRRLNVLLGAA